MSSINWLTFFNNATFQAFYVFRHRKQDCLNYVLDFVNIEFSNLIDNKICVSLMSACYPVWNRVLLFLLIHCPQLIYFWTPCKVSTVLNLTYLRLYKGFTTNHLLIFWNSQKNGDEKRTPSCLLFENLYPGYLLRALISFHICLCIYNEPTFPVNSSSRFLLNILNSYK